MSPRRPASDLRAPFLAIALLAGVIACNGIITGPDDGPDTRPRSLRISPAQLALVLGETGQISAALFDVTGSPAIAEPGVSLGYVSEDPLVATVDGSGLVTATGGGTTRVRAEYGALRLGIPVTVTAFRPQIALVSGDSQTAEQGAALSAPVVVRATGGAGTPVAGVAVTFAVVTGAGTVSAATVTTNTSGLAQTTWTLGSLLGSQSLGVTATGFDPLSVTATAVASTQVTRVVVAPRTATLATPGATTQMAAQAFNAFGGTVPGVGVSWLSLDPAIATVDLTGLVTAVAPGSVGIVASLGTPADTALITVSPPAPLPKLVLGADRAHPAGLQAERTVALPAAAGAPVTVTLRSLEAGRLLLSGSGTVAGAAQADVVVPAGSTSMAFSMHGVEGSSGTMATVIAEAPGYQPDTLLVTLARPGFRLTRVAAGDVPASGGADPILVLTLGEVDGGGSTITPMPVRVGGAAPSFTLSSGTPSIGLLRHVASAQTVGPDQGPAAQVTFGIPAGRSASADGEVAGEPASLRLARTGSAGTVVVDAAGPAEYDVVIGTVGFNVVADPTPVIGASPASLAFTGVVGGATSGEQGVTITNIGTGTLSGLSQSVTYDAGGSGWLSASLSSTTAPATLLVSPQLGTLTAGTYTATIRIASSLGGVAPRDIGVTFTVSAGGGSLRFSLGPDIFVPAGLQDRRQFNLIDPLPTDAPITLRALDPSAVRVSLDGSTAGSASVTLDGSTGMGGFSYWVQGIEGASGATSLVVAEAPGYAPDTMLVSVVRPTFNFYRISADDPPVTGGEDPALMITLGWYEQATGILWIRAVRAGGIAPSFTLVSDNPARAQIRHVAGPATIGADQGPATQVTFAIAHGRWQTSDGEVEGEPISLRLTRTGQTGAVSISVAGPGEYDGLATAVDFTITPLEPPPVPLNLGADFTHPAGLHGDYLVRVTSAVALPLMVTLRSLDPTAVRVSSRAAFVGVATDSVEMEDSTAEVIYVLHGVEGASGRSALLVAEAPGYLPDTVRVTVTRPSFTLTRTDSGAVPPSGGEDPIMVVTVGANDGAGNLIPMPVRPGGVAPSFSVTTDAPARGLVQFFASPATVGADQGPATTVDFALAPGRNQSSAGILIGETASLRLARTGSGGVVNVSAAGPTEYVALMPLTTFTITAPAIPVIEADPTALVFTAIVDAPSPASRTVAVSNSGPGTLSGLSADVAYGAGASDWLALSLGATAAPATLTVTPSTGSIPEGTYTATITIASTVPGVAPVDVTVTLTVDPVPPPGVVTWINPAGGQFIDGANWSSGTMPGAADTAVIALPGTYTVTHVDDVVTLARLVVGGDGGAGDTVTLVLAGVTFAAEGGVQINADGLIDIIGGPMSGGSSGVVNDGTLILRDFNDSPATITSALSGGGTIRVDGLGAITGALTTQNSTRIEIAAQSENEAVLTVANGFENRGQIVLTNLHAEQSALASLVVSSGTLRNEEPGRIFSEYGTQGGARELRAELNNGYWVQVRHNLMIDRPSAAHTSSGYIELSENGGLTILQSGTSPSFTNTQAIVLLDNRTLTIDGGTFAQRGRVLGLGTIDVSTSTMAPAAEFAPGYGELAVTGDLPLDSESLLQLEARSTSFAAAGYGRVTVTGTATLGGALQVSLGEGFVPAIGDSFTILTGASVTGAFGQTFLPALPAGEWVIDYGATSVVLRVTSPAIPVIEADPTALVFTAIVDAPSPASRTVAVSNSGPGTLSGLSADVAYGAGASDWLALSLGGTTAPATLSVTPSTNGVPAGTYTATITIASSVTGVAPVDVAVTLTVNPAPPVGTIFWINPDGGAFDDPANWNTGTRPTETDTVVIALAGTYTVTMTDQVLTLGRLVVGSDGGTGDTVKVEAVVATVNAEGGIEIRAGGSLSIRGDYFSGGPAGVVNDGLLLLTDFNENPGRITSALSGGGTIRVDGLGAITGAFTTQNSTRIEIAAVSSDSAMLTVTNGFENRGWITLTNQHVESAASASLVVTNGTLRNEEPGRIFSEYGTQGGARTLLAELSNGYWVHVRESLTIDRASAAHTSSGYIELSENGGLTILQSGTNPTFTNTQAIVLLDGRTLTVDGGEFAQRGTVTGTGTLDISNTTITDVDRFAPGFGTLAVTGNLPMTAVSALLHTLGGTAFGTGYGRLVVSGTVNADGELNVGLLTGFVPAVGDAFTLVSASSVTGTFASQVLPALPSGVWQVDYTGTSVVLRVVASP